MLDFQNNIKRATDYALAIQNKEGYWLGALDSNCTMEAEFLMLLYFLDVEQVALKTKVVQFILNHQQQNGSWPLYHQGPGDLSTTVECYFALMLAGISKETPNMQLAKAFIIANGGLAKVRVFTQIWLALFGQYSWKNIPLILPEIIFLPTSFPINIYEFASWARATILPLAIVMVKRPVHPIPKSCELTDLILPKPKQTAPGPQGIWQRFFRLLDKGLRIYETLPWKPGRQRALQKITDWIIEHQEADGSWAGIQPPWVYSLIALKLMGYPIDHPIIKKGMDGFNSFSIITEDTAQIQACVSPVWDTGLMVNALTEAGVPPTHPQLETACRWLIHKQIKTGGDWQIKNPALAPGGWAFEFENNHYPDIDDTAEILMALWHLKLPEKEDSNRLNAIKQGLAWITGMRSKQGAWAAFDQDNDNFFLAKFPFFDFGEILDPPSVDVTAHVLEMLGKLGYQNTDPIVQSALTYIYKEQESDGSWFGRWGVNYIYGIGTVLPALKAVGEPYHALIEKAEQWLLKHQNKDGGWGESCASYVNPTLRGQGVSTPSQTAWALLGLMAYDKWDYPAVRKGIEYLCTQMNSLGTWDEDEYTGCGFPGYGIGKQLDQSPDSNHNEISNPSAGFMINYHLYRHCWPLIALGRYQHYVIKNTKEENRKESLVTCVLEEESQG